MLAPFKYIAIPIPPWLLVATIIVVLVAGAVAVWFGVRASRRRGPE